MKHSQRAKNRSGFVLIIAIVMIALLTIMAVAFLSSTTLDRATSSASVNKAKADLAARAAVNAAIAQLTDAIAQFPDSATTWETINGNAGTYLYYRDQTPEQAIASNNPAKLYVLPCISGGTAQLVANKTNSLPALTDSPPATANAFNFNHQRFAGDTQGEIGAPPVPPTTSPPPPFRGQWINMTDSDGKITGRYAFWMEDESFKVNANLMGPNPRGSNTLGDSPNQVPFQGLLRQILAPAADPNAVAQTLVNFRNPFPSSQFFELGDLGHAPGQPTLADTAKFEATIFSGSSNVSRGGVKRINLNKVVTSSTDPAAIRTQLDEIISAIKYQLPNFGQRFYRIGTNKNTLDVPTSGAPSHSAIYLNKIAANIRDYIDTDSQPTIVISDLSVNIGSPPVGSIPPSNANGATNEAIAIGKEAVPFIQEYMLRVKQLEPQKRPLPTATANYKIEIDHYVEFWNMTNRDIVVASLGSNPFLGITNQFAWTSYGGTDIPVDPGRDIRIPLTSFRNANGDSLVFAAGAATVLTTDPVSLPASIGGVDPAKVFRPPSGTPAGPLRVYAGTCKAKSSGNYPHLDAIPRSPPTAPSNPSTSSDIETEIILGNDKGVLESFGAPSVYYISVNADTGTQTTNTSHIDTTKYFFRASSPKGNSPFFSPTVSQVGDPRTNNEQISLNSAKSVGDDQTNFKTELNNNSPPTASNNDASPTRLNSTYVDSTLWIDPSANTADAPHAPAVVANASLTSIGQLGDIFDPVRLSGVSGDIKLSHGGGRTFKIGQPDRYDATTDPGSNQPINPSGLWDGDSTSASREWTAWRLTDVFGTSDLLQREGVININGVARDGGAALKTALFGYSFESSPDSDPNLAGQAFDADPTNATDKITILVSQLQTRLSNLSPFNKTVGPLAERGELSELPLFNSGKDLSASVNTNQAYDRGREELFRRLSELITTRGNVFTVYAVGQALTAQPAGAKPILASTSQIRVTFQITPAWTPPLPPYPFDPTTNDRFRKPDHYAIKILYAGD
ncbi:MAG: hypothetical protein ACR2HH_02885 [Chthoniobacterales bacterium]